MGFPRLAALRRHWFRLLKSVAALKRQKPAALAGFFFGCRLNVSPACVSINVAATLPSAARRRLAGKPNSTGRAAVILTRRPAFTAGFSRAS